MKKWVCFKYVYGQNGSLMTNVATVADAALLFGLKFNHAGISGGSMRLLSRLCVRASACFLEGELK